MELPPHILESSSPDELADILFQTEKELKGKNLRRASWREFAQALAVPRIGTILLQRLQAASSREDVLRILCCTSSTVASA